MSRIMCLALALTLAGPARGQGVLLQAVPADTAPIAARADAAMTTALAAQAAIPPRCASPPATDTVGGTAGSGAVCVHSADAASATVVMPASAVTAGDGGFSGSWPGAFATPPTTAFAAVKTTTDPYICQVGTATATAYSGKCWRVVQTITLPTLATSLLGLVLTPGPPASAGLTVMVVGRQ